MLIALTSSAGSPNWPRLRYDSSSGKYEQSDYYGYVHPFLGYEVGCGALRDIPVEGFTASRPKARLAGNFTRHIGRIIDSIGLSATITYRYLMNDEYIVVDKENDEGEEETAEDTVEAGGAHFLEATLSVNVTPHFSFEIKYQNGRLPPVFRQTDTTTAGFSLKF